MRKMKDSRPENSRGFNEAKLSCIEQPSHDAGVCDRKRSSMCVMHHSQYTSWLTLASSSLEKSNSPHLVNQ